MATDPALHIGLNRRVGPGGGGDIAFSSGSIALTN